MRAEVFIMAVLLYSMVIFLSSMVKAIDLSEQQILESTDQLTNNTEILSHNMFVNLTLPEICAQTKLTKCHINEDMYYRYYERCFSDVCPKEDYYCLNHPNGYPLHICGKSDKCKKRRRNIAVQDSKDPVIIHVYSIACPPGYFQDNMNICFDICVNDVSVAIQTSTDTTRTVARCKSEDGYCNPNNVTFFEMGSKEDRCSYASQDFKLFCGKGKELFPDCSCTQICRFGEERDWNGTLMCVPKQKSSDMSNSQATKAIDNEGTERDNYNSSLQTNYQNTDMFETTSETPKNNKDPSKETSEKTENSDTVLIVVLALVIIFAMFVVTVVKLRIKSKRKRDRTETGQEKKIEKIRIGDNINIGDNVKGVAINHPSCEKLLSQSYQDESEKGSLLQDVTTSGQACVQPLMQTLKVPIDQQVGDSGVYSVDETAVKSVV